MHCFGNSWVFGCFHCCVDCVLFVCPSFLWTYIWDCSLCLSKIFGHNFRDDRRRGNFGTLLTQLIFLRGSKYKTKTGITLMGVMLICCTLPIVLLYFPQRGGMFCGPSSSKDGSGITNEEYYMNE
ncbi:hypothetical protein ACSBR2_006642 [Camellia fascicularis]